MMLVILVGVWAEERAVEKHLEVLDKKEIEGMPVTLGSHGDKAVLLCRTGIGEERTVLVERGILGAYNPGAVVSLRIARSVPKDLGLGDHVICRQTHLWRTSGELTRGSRESDPRLLAIAEQAAGSTGRNFAVMKALTISPIVPEPLDQDAAERSPSLGVVDTEGYWLAEMAFARDLPFLAVRTSLGDIFDRVPEVVRLASTRGKVNPLRYLLHTASQPARLPDLVALRGAVKQAARSLSAFTGEFLSAWSREP
jgi:nucleoside phosphorylase